MSKDRLETNVKDDDAQKPPVEQDLRTFALRPSTTTQSTTTLNWSGHDDPENPFNWTLSKKWLVTALALLASFTTMMNGTMLTVAHEPIGHEFNVSDAHFPHSYWPVASWTIGGGFSCLVVLPIMEDFGMRPAFLGTYAVFVCFLIPQALARNFATLVISRFFAGACVSILANTAAGVIGNIWEGDRGRTVPTSLYITAYLTGSSGAPVIGAVILENLGWRWISYMQLIWFGVMAPLYVFLFPETRGSTILQRRHRQHRTRSSSCNNTSYAQRMTPLLPKLKQSVTRPLYMLFTELVLFTFTIWSAFMVGTVYLFTQSVEQVFAGLYSFTPSQAGYVQSAIVIGERLGCLVSICSSPIYFRSASRNVETPGQPIPEARLYMGILTSFVAVAGGMFVYGFTSVTTAAGSPSLPWPVPAIGLVLVGLGITVIVTAIADYILDAYAKYAGSAVAALVLGEDIFAAFLPLASSSMYQTLGFRWASALLGFLALGISAASVGVVLHGRTLRARSPFMEGAKWKGSERDGIVLVMKR